MRIADIERVLRTRHRGGRNAFWLSHGTDRFPDISILVIGDRAYMLYFPREGHPGFASIGTVPGLPPGGITNFFPDDGDEPFDIVNEAIVRFEDALKVAQEFAISPALPKSMRWSEL
jgi:hypothetical protein